MREPVVGPQSLVRERTHFPDRTLWLLQRWTGFCPPNTWPMALRSALAPSMTNSRRRSARSPRSTNSSSRPSRTEGCKRYPEADCLHILADSGGSNGCTPRAWKFNLQHRLCNRHGLRVTVAHYPTAASKWNPIEHRLFCEISKNWAGRPLDSFETILKYLRTTRTAAGLRVRAHRVKKVYKTGVKVADAQMRELHITEDSVLPKWNYTIEPIEPM